MFKLGDETNPEDCALFYRPSFGRQKFYGEFDAMIITPKKAYLVESKWDRSGDLTKGLEKHQVLRHEIFSWFHNNWKGEEGKAWDKFAKENNPAFKKKFKSKYIPSSSTTLGQNLQTVLKEIGNKVLENVLLIFYEDQPIEVTQEGFTTINIKYKPTLGLFNRLQ
ncbi:MAG: hypothetical protein P1Q69_03695 [Candidatus Thorarchaeota archaeon]|nr:hypothetical protein [Candidatus Thorarchaeota archaeon]